MKRHDPEPGQMTWCSASSAAARSRAPGALVGGDVEPVDEREAESVERDRDRQQDRVGPRGEERTPRCATRAAAAPTATHLQNPSGSSPVSARSTWRNCAGPDGQRGDEQQQLGEPSGATEWYAGSRSLSRDRRGGNAHEGQPSVEGSVTHCWPRRAVAAPSALPPRGPRRECRR